MFIASIVISALVIVVFSRSALPKLRRLKAVTATAEHLRVPVGLMYTVGYLEVLGAVGLAAGLAYTPVGVAAACGLALLMLGATVSHLRVRDYATSAAPLLVGVVCAALAVLDVLRS